MLNMPCDESYVVRFVALLLFVLFVATGWSQTNPGEATVSSTTVPTSTLLTLDDALQLAAKNAPQFRAAVTDAAVAHEDRVQARAALLPNISYSTGAIWTEGNGTSTGRFIGANGVHEYLSQGVAREALGFDAVANLQRATALEALARARKEIATRGLVATVVQNFYGAVAAQQKMQNAQLAADEANRFTALSQKLEAGGEVAHSDVIKAQLQANDRQRELQEAKLAADKAKLDLAVLIFPNFNDNFELKDDLQQAPELPGFAGAQALASRNNPELAAASAAMHVADNEVTAAFAGHLPSLSVNYFYGIDAPQYATRSDGVRNLGYQVAATIDLPIFSWGATESKVRQAQLRRDQARVELSAAQRQAIADLRLFYEEARTARTQIDILRQSADLAAESLRLTNLRYQAGEATALEVVDAQNALVAAHNNLSDGLVRYRVAVATLQTLTGSF